MLTRRDALLGAASAGVAGALGCSLRAPGLPPLVGDILGRERAERGHRLWTPQPPAQDAPASRYDVVIVGAGVAGLSAAWRLRTAGFEGTVAILELGDTVGGTAAAGTGPEGPFALGAHYITLPNPEARHVRRMLHNFGVIEHFDSDNRPRYNPAHLCLAPQERLFIAGKWIPGLWPELGATADDEAQYAAFLAICEDWTARVGADGRHAFSIPLAHASRDPDIRALAEISFDAWLTQQGFTSPRLRWLAGYACRDDYGSTLTTTSAWAGLHYHCARRPDPAHARDIGTAVLTWPAGNGWLVKRLLEASRATVHTGVVVRSVEPDAGRVYAEFPDGVRRLDAERVILAVPAGIVDRLIQRPPGLRLSTAPWRVALLHCDASPASEGTDLAWDSVIYDAPDLGYISSAHQRGTYGGPTVLTWYEPLGGADANAARRELLTATWASEADRVMSLLAPAHPDLRARVQRLDIWHWGHGTVEPRPGVHAVGALEGLSAPVGRVHLAHTDQSGMSLFEEASWHGCRAAEAALRSMGRAVPDPLISPPTPASSSPSPG